MQEVVISRLVQDAGVLPKASYYVEENNDAFTLCSLPYNEARM